MDKIKLIGLLKDYNPQDVEKFASYIEKMANEKTKDGKVKNAFLGYYKEEKLAELFKRVEADGLKFDGVHVTLQSNGISYDYVAYKNKMLLAYPESVIDLELVYEGDTFDVSKDSGKITYKHTIKDAFKRDEANIIGGYCIIKNKRGESLTTLNMDDIEKHRKVAKTDFIWQDWFTEMAKKTVMKKACKTYYQDIYETIESNDNEQYNLENPLDIDLTVKAIVDTCKDEAELKSVYDKYKSTVENVKSFNKYVSIKKLELAKAVAK